MAIPIPRDEPLPPPGSYTLQPLRRYDFADYHALLLHLTGRRADPFMGTTLCNDSAILNASPIQRLGGILRDGVVGAFPMFGNDVPAACFTENSRSALDWLISERRYAPWGVAFTKDLVFAQGGSPVIEVRGDDWPTANMWPDDFRGRVKRLWPGVNATPGVKIPWYLTNPSEWSFEREWRLPLKELTFTAEDVQFVIAESTDALEQLRRLVGPQKPEMAQRLATLPNLTWDPVAKRLVG